jgi:hypothetical protein
MNGNETNNDKETKMNAVNFKYQVKAHKSKVADASGNYVNETTYEAFSVCPYGTRAFLGFSKTRAEAKRLCEESRAARLACAASLVARSAVYE